MKTLLFSNQGLSPSHLGIELEIIEKEIADGNEVRILYCKSNLQSCFFNASHNLLACSICEGRTKVFYDKIGFPKKDVYPLQNLTDSFALPPIQTIDDIFNIRYKGYDIGRGIAASYISTRRNYEYDKGDYEFVKEMGIMCANIIENIQYQIKTFNPKNIILFNGRFAEQNAIIEVCQKQNVDYATFERSSAKGKYKYFKNMLPHSLANRATEMKRLWEQKGSINKEKISKEWFDTRKNGGTGLIKAFLSKQKHGELPKGFNKNKQNIAIFVTSEDEHKAVKEHYFDQYENQNEAIEKILSHFLINKDLHFYLRVHPHLRNIDSAQTREIAKMKYPNLTVIKAGEKTDTYELMKACNRVVTFGSTTGIEAAYLGRPSILFGHSYYQSLDCAYYPKDYATLFRFIENASLSPKPIENTYPFAFYQSMIGINHSKFIEGGKNNSKYNNEPIKRVYLKTIFTLVRNIKDWSKWNKMNKLIFKEPLSLKNMFKLNSHVFNEKLK